MGMNAGLCVERSILISRSFFEQATSIVLRDLQNARASGFVLVLKSSLLVQEAG